jgi:subtilisin family serine protease
MIFYNCNTKPTFAPITAPPNPINHNVDLKQIRHWQHKDIINDSIPGISLEKAYDFLYDKKQIDTIIIAVIDTEIDINHEDLRKNIWRNPNEIANNGIDDDNNGYTDDIHGWNFLGDSLGNTTLYTHFEVTRILKSHMLLDSLSFDNKLYQSAKKEHENLMKVALDNKQYGDFLFENYPKSKQFLKNLYPKENYSLEILDSLYLSFKNEGKKEKQKLVYFMKDFLKYQLTENWINDYKTNADAMVDKILNVSYDERSIIKDDVNDINNTVYGNNKVSQHIDKLYHGTEVSGVISAERNNNIGIDGILNACKIMTLCTAANGDMHDKDIALAIRYAVNNGASIINLSFGKQYSLKNHWLIDAMKYAAKNNVLIIRAAGNEQLNLDNFKYYPNDAVNSEEFVSNFITVASSSPQIDSTLNSYFTNYSKNEVDIFAPGIGIYTTSASKDKYISNEQGSSYSSALTSGVAALLYSYYPNLTASQIKHIIMDSGVEYTFPVKVPIKDSKKDTLIEFNKLSKSGKIVNAYNALIMADSISKNN